MANCIINVEHQTYAPRAQEGGEYGHMEMTLRQAAMRLNLPYGTVYQAWRAGRIPNYRVQNGSIYVNVNDVKEVFRDYKPRGSCQPRVRTAPATVEAKA